MRPIHPIPLPSIAVVALVFLVSITIGCGHQAEQEARDVAEATVSNTIVIPVEQAASLDITTAAVVHDVFRFWLPVPGVVLPAPDHEMIVSAPVDGRVARLCVQEGDRVAIGDPLVEIESLTIGNLVADYIQARADAVYMRGRVERLQKLLDKGVGSLREVERTRADARRADASLIAARSRLVAIGFNDSDLEAWDAGSTAVPRLTIRAGIEGVVSRNTVALGEAVALHELMFVIVDPTHVLVRAFLSPQDLALVRSDGEITVHEDETDQGKHLAGAIATINPTLDDLNRSATVNAILASEDGWPTPGQNLRVQVEAITPTPVSHVPLSAIVFEGESAVVYVSLGEHRYEKRRVTIARMTSEAAIISSGLADGDHVAVSNVFALKALGRLEQYGEE